MTKLEYRNKKRNSAVGVDGIEKIRRILEDKTARKVNEVLVDTFSASAIITVYDALSDDRKEKFVSFTIRRMSAMSFDILESIKSN